MPDISEPDVLPSTGEDVGDVAERVLNYCVELNNEGKLLDAIALYGRYIDHWISHHDQEASLTVCLALNNRGRVLARLGRQTEAIESYRALQARYGGTTDPEVRVQLARSLVDTGISQAHLHNTTLALEAFDRAIMTVGPVGAMNGAEEELILDGWDTLANALLWKGNVLMENRRFDEALTYFARIVETFGECDYVRIHFYLASALLNTGLVKAEQKRFGDAAACFREVERAFGNTTRPEISKIRQQAFQMHGRLPRKFR